MESILRGALAASTLFQGCAIDETLFSLRRYSAGQMIDDTLDGIASVGLIISGRVDVYSVAVDGRDVRLNSLHMGECFGIYNLLAGTGMETVLRCAEDTEVGYISKALLVKQMEMDQRLSRQYAKLCNEKLRFLICRIEHLTMQTCRGKLAAYLLTQRDPGGRIILSCSREELARQLGMSRAALFRELAALQTRGVLLNQRGVFYVPDAGALEQLLYQSPNSK